MSEDFKRTRDALVRAAYRALLQREPDAAAEAELSSPRYPEPEEQDLVEILRLFIRSEEFIALQEAERRHVEPEAVPTAFAELRSQIRTLIDAAERLEARLPAELHERSLPLERYPEHYERWIRHARLGPEVNEDRPMSVLVEARDSTSEELEETLQALALQSHQAFSVRLGVKRRQLAAAQDLLFRTRRNRTLDLDCVVVDEAKDWPCATTPADVVVVMRCGVLHVDALRRIDVELSADGAGRACYVDEDRLSPEDRFLDWRLRRHENPQLKGGFDFDLLLQTPYVGSLIAFTSQAWRTAEAQTADGAHADAVLAALVRLLGLGAEGPASVKHIPAVLISTYGDDPRSGDMWRKAVGRHLRGRARVSPHSVAHGPALSSASRVSWPIGAASAAIIIPTHDRVDLLQPCVESVLKSLEANRARARLDIIDHESRLKATKTYLRVLGDRPEVTVRRFEGPFNWALMNNAAAREATEDVLVFLNNDTLVVSEDWLDELVSLARRPDVGVVGARLLYADGDVQHAGFLGLDEPTRFLMHDGLNAPAEAPGYLNRNLLTHRSIAVTGACMAVRREVFHTLGGFDASRFQVEANDVDFCFRASAAGLKVLYSPHATLHHLESKTRDLDTDEARRASAEAAERLWSRWGAAVCPDPWYNPNFDRHGRPFERLRPL